MTKTKKTRIRYDLQICTSKLQNQHPSIIGDIATTITKLRVRVETRTAPFIPRKGSGSIIVDKTRKTALEYNLPPSFHLAKLKFEQQQQWIANATIIVNWHIFKNSFSHFLFQIPKLKNMYPCEKINVSKYF